MKASDAKDIIIFRSDEKMNTPAQVIFYILELAAREARFGVAGKQTLWHHIDVENELNEYVQRQRDE